jgi:hypothetical protein
VVGVNAHLVVLDVDRHALDEAPGIVEPLRNRMQVPHERPAVHAEAGGDVVDRVLFVVGELGDEVKHPAQLGCSGIGHAPSG